MSRIDNRGFTLIETMAAVVIFSIAIAAALSTFEFQQKSYTTQSRVSETQKNVREAMELLARDIRLAGYGIPGSPFTVTVPSGTLPFGLTQIRTVVSDDSTTSSDNITLIYLYDMDGNQPSTYLSSAFTASSSAGVSVNATTGFVEGDLFMVASDQFADIYKLSAPTANPIPNGATTPLFNTGHSGRSYPAGTGSVVAKARFVKYYIDRSDPAHPALMLDKLNGQPPQRVADDIEDMQFEYTLADGTTGWDNIIDSTQIRQVRIMLCGRSAITEKGWSETQPALGDHTTGLATTGHRRRILDMTVDIRNAAL